MPRRYAVRRGAFAVLTGACLWASVQRAAARSTEWVPDQLLLRAHAACAGSAHTRVVTEGARKQGEIPELGVVIVRTPPGMGRVVARHLRNSSLFRYVEHNYLVQADAVPNDPLYPQQWGLPITHVPEAWSTTAGAGVVIAMVDTGVDLTHPDLIGRLLPGFNTITNSTDAADDNGHGTRMAGIAGATGFNGLGVIGVAPEAEIMPIKAMDATGTGTYADIAQAIVYAADHGAQVINLSLGGPIDSSTLADAVAYAESKGVVVAAAAGNDGIAAPNYPAAYPGVIAVGASDAQDGHASFSNFGPWLSLVAPGVGITTTDLGGGYADSTGTSPATPFVAGAAALLLSVNPTLRPNQVAALLTMTSDDLGPPGFDDDFGWGRLNVAAAVAQAASFPATSTGAPPTVSVTVPEDAAPVQGLVTLAVATSDEVEVARVEYAVDDAVVASVTGPQFSATWDASELTPGPHLLTATAYDVAGNRGDAPAQTLQIAGVQPTCSTLGSICLPGGGTRRTACVAQWLLPVTGPSGPQRRSRTVLTCTDGAPCDADGKADGVCTFNLGLCFNVPQPPPATAAAARSACEPTALQGFSALLPLSGGDAVDVLNAATLVTAVAALGSDRATGVCSGGLVGATCAQDSDCDSAPGMNDGSCGLQQTSLAGVVGTAERCTAVRAFRVPLRQTFSGWRRSSRRLHIVTTAAGTTAARPRSVADSLRLVCVPAK